MDVIAGTTIRGEQGPLLKASRYVFVPIVAGSLPSVQIHLYDASDLAGRKLLNSFVDREKEASNYD